MYAITDKSAAALHRLHIHKKIKEARKPPYHFINQNLNRFMERIHVDVCRKIKIACLLNCYIKFSTSLIQQMYVKNENYKRLCAVKITLKWYLFA